MHNRRRVSHYIKKNVYRNEIELLEEIDAVAAVGYLFNLTKDTRNHYFFDDDDSFELLIRLAEKMNLHNRMYQVLQDIRDYYARKGDLHLYTPKNRKEEIPSKYLYEEDIEVDRRIDFKSNSNYVLNYFRIMNIPGKGLFSQILYYTFFSKAKINLNVFHENIPARFNNKIHNTSKIDFIKKELKLSEAESEYLLFRYRKLTVDNLGEVMGTLTNDSIELYTKAIEISKQQYNQITRRDSKLRQYGFIDEERNLNPAIIECIEAQDFSLYFTDCIKEQNLEEIYNLESFSVPEKNSSIYKGLLKSEDAVSVLLYGAPGAGKTEYARALVKSSGKKALVFKNEAELLSKTDVLGRLNCLLSLNRKDTVLIIDEADSLLATSMMTMFGPVSSKKQKGIVNKMLEESQNKVIWIVNYKSQIDESTLRRFTVSYKFEPMSSMMLESIAEKKLGSLNIEENTRKEILKLLSQYKVTGASVDNLVKTINCMDSKNSKNLLENIGIVLRDNSSLLHGESKMRTHVKDSYDMSVLNTSISSDRIMGMLYNAKKFADKNPGSGAVRILFYGHSGTGKTEFARYISESLGKELLLKRASDIFDKYVGGTEQNIASAFEEAATNDQILLFDEADSFFSDRNSAQRNYERTMVNEFLTQLEEFPGIVICTTNLRKIMDPAMLRRFHIAVDFKSLEENGIKKLLNKFFKGYDFEEKMICKLADYKTVTPGDFGRLSETIKFMDCDEITAVYIIDQLCKIQREKSDSGEEHIKIGFCA